MACGPSERPQPPPGKHKDQRWLPRRLSALRIGQLGGTATGEPRTAYCFGDGRRGASQDYRWRHIEEPELRPDLIRPINHYAPLFNPVDAQSTLRSQEYAFLKLQQVLEFVLVSLNVQLLIEAKSEIRLRARDAFVSEVQREIEIALDRVSAAFPQSDDPIWLRAKKNDLERLVQELRPIQRLMLGFPQLVAPRLKQDRLRFETAVGEGGRRC